MGAFVRLSLRGLKSLHVGTPRPRRRDEFRVGGCRERANAKSENAGVYATPSPEQACEPPTNDFASPELYHATKAPPAAKQAAPLRASSSRKPPYARGTDPGLRARHRVSASTHRDSAGTACRN